MVTQAAHRNGGLRYIHFLKFGQCLLFGRKTLVDVLNIAYIVETKLVEVLFYFEGVENKMILFVYFHLVLTEFLTKEVV